MCLLCWSWVCFGSVRFLEWKKTSSFTLPLLFYSFLLCTLLFWSLLVCLLYCFYDHSVVRFGTAWYGTVVCVCAHVRERDRQGGSVGDVAGQGRGRGQTGWTKVTPTVCVYVSVYKSTCPPQYSWGCGQLPLTLSFFFCSALFLFLYLNICFNLTW